jgi:hypothetical protein
MPSPELLNSEPIEIVEIDDAALFGSDPVVNTCCLPPNTDCSCLINVIFGCGRGGCGEE